MPEEPVIDCHLSKDLEFARNLARQMRSGYGRHNSNRSFRDQQSMRYNGMVRYAGVDLAHGPDQMAVAWMENQQARVIGRFQDRYLRSSWKDCQIGDAVRMEDFGEAHPDALFVERIKPKPRIFDGTKWCDPIELTDRWTFERIRTEVTPDNGRTWHDQTIWKRIE